MSIRIGTSAQSGTFYSQGEAIVALLRSGGVASEVVVTPLSGAINAKRLEAGEVDFGFIAANWIGRARRGQPPFDAPLGIRMAAPMNVGPLFFVTQRASGMKDVRAIRGKRVVVGPHDSGMANHAEVMLGALGIEFSDFDPLYLDFADGADALIRDKADAQLQCPIPNQVMSDLDASIDLRVLSYSDDDLGRVVASSPIYRATTMKKGALRALHHDIEQPAVLNVLITHERVAKEMVRTLVAALVAGRTELASTNRLFKGLPDLFEPLRTRGLSALEFDGVELHEGAVEAYRGAGLV
jgi:TRAP transporter TAXI family solute receptor